MPRLSSLVVLLPLILVNVLRSEEFPQQPGEQVAPNQLLLKPKRGALVSAIIVSAGGGAAILRRVPGLDIHVLQLPPGAPGNVLSRILGRHAQVEFVEPNRIRHVSGLPIPNDPSYASQWALQAVKALPAWTALPGRYLTSNSPGASRIKVAVLDTGGDCTHPDFRNSGGTTADSAQGGQLSFALSRAFVPTSFPSPACSWLDDYGHGTHVAGTIAAAGNNGTGVSALGYPLELVVYKVLDSAGNGTDATIAEAIRSAADSGARVVSLSLGAGGYSQTMQTAVNYAWERDCLVVAAAGNSNSSYIFFPAGANFAVGVAASDSSGNKASFSNYGDSVDIAAPGVNILSTMPGYPGTRLGTQNYGSLSGTSMATPHVSALAGLLAMTTPNLPAAAIAQRIQQSAVSGIAGGGWSQTLGYGIIDAIQAVSGVLRPAAVGGFVGQVVHSSAMPVNGAVVSIGGQNVTTSFNGLFRFQNLAAGSYTVTASAPDYPTQTTTVAVTPGADTSASIVMGIATGTFSGFVTSGGAPVPGATVQALSGGLIKATAFTNSSGSYTMSVPAGSYDVRAAAVSRLGVTAAGRSVAAGSTATVDFSMSGMRAITGTVKDANLTPLANARITVTGADFTAGASSDSSGRFSTIGVPPGMYSVSAALPGYQEALAPAISVGVDNAAVVDLQLPHIGTLSLLTLSPSSIGGGASTLANKVTLSGPAPAGGGTVALSSSNTAVAAVPASVIVPAGQSVSPAFTITSSGVSVSTVVTITASYGVVARSANLTVYPIALSSLSLSPAVTAGGKSTTYNRVTLNSLAPPGGIVVALSSADNSVAAVPATVTVAAGTSSSPYFTITTNSVGAPAVVPISASYGGAAKSAELTVNPVSLSFLSVAPVIVGGKTTIASATLDAPAPAGGAIVSLSSNNAAVSMPASVTVAAGAVRATFAISTSTVTAQTVAAVSGVCGGVARTKDLTVNPAALYAVSVPGPVAGGKSAAGSITLDGPAPAGGAVVQLISANPAAASLPASTTVAAGATTATFTITTHSVSSPTLVTLSAVYSGVTKSKDLTVSPGTLSSLSMAAGVPGGKTTAASVTLNSPAPAGGAVVVLTSANPSAASVPAAVTVAAGASSAPFTIKTSAVASATVVAISGTYGGVTKSKDITVYSGTLLSLSVPAMIAGGKAAAGTATLDSPAPAGGAVVTLTSANPAAASVPAAVTVAGGASSATFTITTHSVSTPTAVAIAGVYGGVTKSREVTVNPGTLYYISFAVALAGGKTTAGTAVLDSPAPAGGAVVTLTSANPSAASVPASVTVAAGANSATFTITTHSVNAPTAVAITGVYGGVARSREITVKPGSLYYLSLPPAVPGGKTAIGSATLDSPAPAGGAVVSLTSTNPALVSVPPSLTVPAGAASATFTITTHSVTTAAVVTISGSYGGVTRPKDLRVDPATLSAISVTSVLTGGKAAAGTATLTAPAPAGGVQVNLSSGNTAAAAVPILVTVPAGAVSAVFAIATQPVSAQTVVAIAASVAGVTKSANMTLRVPGLTALSISPYSVVGSAPFSAMVALDVPAPAGGITVSLTSGNSAAASVPASVTVPAGAAASAAFTISTYPVAAQTTAAISAQYGGVTRTVNVTVKP